MPVTPSYDLIGTPAKHRKYLRNMFERFRWKGISGSVFRYYGWKFSGVVQEDWLNDVAPAIMFFRSYVLRNNIPVGPFRLDTISISRVERRSNFARRPQRARKLALKKPTNDQSSAKELRHLADAAIKAA